MGDAALGLAGAGCPTPVIYGTAPPLRSPRPSIPSHPHIVPAGRASRPAGTVSVIHLTARVLSRIPANEPTSLSGDLPTF
jgi:hypothetical protein